MKNYYQILEVSENASPEVIEKAYRVLANINSNICFLESSFFA